MEENNNQPVTPTPEAAPVAPEVPVTPVAPVAPEVPVTPEAPVVPEAAPAPIETPVAPVTPEVTPTPEVAPAAPEVGPAPEVAPIAPEAPVAPVTPEVAATPEVAPAPAEVPVGDPNMAAPIAATTPEALPAEPEPEKKRSQVLPIIIIIVCVLGIAGYLLYPKLFKKEEAKPTPTPSEVTPTPDTPTETTVPEVNTITFNGNGIVLPADKAVLDTFGWTWSVDTTTTEVQPGDTLTGVKLGSETGGAEVSAKNTGTEVVMLEECKFYSVTFHNPGDGSENVTFVGGLDYSTTPGTLTAKMSELGFTNGKEENGVYTYYKEDNQSNTEDYIAFSFNGDVLTTVTVNSSIN